MTNDNLIDVVNIRDSILIGEGDFNDILSDFSCERDEDVEKFLIKNSVEFTKKNQSVTYLVMCDGLLLGYFTLTIKPIHIDSTNFSNNTNRKIERISTLENGQYLLSSYLIAQIGKNDKYIDKYKISLLEIAIQAVMDMQHRVGGMVTFLEVRDDKHDLINYYENKGFRKFGEKINSKGDHNLIQMLKIIK